MELQHQRERWDEAEEVVALSFSARGQASYEVCLITRKSMRFSQSVELNLYR